MGIGLGEIFLLMFLVGMVAVIFAVFFFLAKYLFGIGGKTCPHCAERIKAEAKVCRYCHMDVTGVRPT